MNKFKRALSSLLAFTMVLSMITVMNVSSVFATPQDYGEVSTSDDGTTKTWDFTTNMPTSANVSLVTGDTVQGIKIVSATSSNFKISKSSYLSVQTSTMGIPVPENSAGTITLYDSNIKSDRYWSREKESDDEEESNYKKSVSTAGTVYSFTSATSFDGYVEFTASGGEAKTTKIVVTLTTGTYDVVAQDTYTITGTCNLTNTAIKVGTYEATTDAEGKFTVSKSVDNGTDAPFKAGDEFVVTADDYDSQTVALTAVEGSTTEFTVGEVTLTKIELTALENGKYESFLLPNFEAGDDFSTTDAEKRSKFTGSLNFKLDTAKNVTFTVKCGSTTEGKTASFTLKDSDGNDVYAGGTMAAGADAVTISKALAAGTYTIVGDNQGTGTTLQITSIVVAEADYYYAYFTEENVNNWSEYSIVDSEGNVAGTGDTVYKNIDVDGDGEGDLELSGDYAYVVAYIVDGAGETTDFQEHFRVVDSATLPTE